MKCKTHDGPTVDMAEHEVDAMINGLTEVILNLERFANENKHHMLDANLRDAMNLTASMLGACSELKEPFETGAAGYWQRG